METTADAPIVVRDVFPARVVHRDRVLTSARVVITRDRVLAYIRRGEPALDEPYEPALSVVPAYNAPATQPAHLELPDGSIITVTRQRGCGCGSTVRSWRPWQPWRVAR